MTDAVNNMPAGLLAVPPQPRPERSDWVLILIALLVLFMHVTGLLWLREPMPQQTASEAKPFKMEVNFLPSSNPKITKPTTQPVKPEPKTPPKKQPEKTSQKDKEKTPPQKQQPQPDWAAVEKLIKTQPMKLVSRAVKSQPGSQSKQSVSAAMIQKPAENPQCQG